MSDFQAALLVTGIIMLLCWLIYNMFGQIVELSAARDRTSDALGGAQRKLSAIRDLLNTPRTIRKGDVALILDGETL